MNDRTEEEQVEAIKAWFKENGIAIITGLVIGVALIGGYRYWTHTQDTKAKQASVLYNEINQALTSSQPDKILEQGKKLVTEFPDTAYATLATLAMAKVYVEQDKLDAAVEQLNQVINKASDTSMQHLARVRLARVMLAQNKAKDVLTLTAGQTSTAFAAAYAEVRGDAFLMVQQSTEAMAAYKEALANSNLQADQRQLIQMKLNNIVIAK